MSFDEKIFKAYAIKIEICAFFIHFAIFCDVDTSIKVRYNVINRRDVFIE